MLLPPSRLSEDPIFPARTWVRSLILEKWLITNTLEAFAKVLTHLLGDVPIMEQIPPPDM